MKVIMSLMTMQVNTSLKEMIVNKSLNAMKVIRSRKMNGYQMNQINEKKEFLILCIGEFGNSFFRHII